MLTIHCPRCQTALALDPATITASHGWARCGQCQHVFDAASLGLPTLTPKATAASTAAVDLPTAALAAAAVSSVGAHAPADTPPPAPTPQPQTETTPSEPTASKETADASASDPDAAEPPAQEAPGAARSATASPASADWRGLAVREFDWHSIDLNLGSSTEPARSPQTAPNTVDGPRLDFDEPASNPEDSSDTAMSLINGPVLEDDGLRNSASRAGAQDDALAPAGESDDFPSTRGAADAPEPSADTALDETLPRDESRDPDGPADVATEPDHGALAVADSDADVRPSDPAHDPTDAAASPTDRKSLSGNLLDDDLPPPRPKRALKLLILLALLLALAGQVTYTQRHWLAARYPELKPALQQLCDWAACQLKPWRDVTALDITQSAVVRLADTHFQVDLDIHNQGLTRVEIPQLELSLQDEDGHTWSRRVLPLQVSGNPPELLAHKRYGAQVNWRTDEADASRVKAYQVRLVYDGTSASTPGH